MTPLHTLLAVLINLIWGSMFIAASIGLEEFPPLLFTAIRFALLAVLLSGFLKVPRELLFSLVKIGLVMGLGMYLSLYLSIALAENTASIAVFSKLEVPFALILGVILLKEHIGPKRIAGITIAMVGALLISFDPAALDDLVALFWMAISCGFSAYAMIQVRRLGKIHPLTITAWVSLIGAPALMLNSLVFESAQLTVMQQASSTGWIALLYTAIMGSVLAHSGFYYLLQRYPVGLVSPFTLLSPIFAVIGGLLFLDDQLTGGLIVGGLLILAGVAWINARVTQAQA
ncbi:MAG: O-acetylserine/cysteine efflux transporter [Planctomycetota bacterium]